MAKGGTRSKRQAAEEEMQADADFLNDDHDDDIEEDEGPPSIDPYDVLGLEGEATADDVKKAYRKLALKHHPDKAAPADKDAANKNFQEIAFAYAVLSDDRRRKRYDLTGSTAETVEDDDDFNWLSFYREQFENVVNEEAINRLSNEYKGSADERRDLLNAYTKGKGNLNKVYELVMLSDILVDDDRFRQILDEEVANGAIESFPIYEQENNDARRQRAKDIEQQRRDAYDKRQADKEASASTNGKSNGKAKSKAKKAGAGDMADLAALIQSRQKARSGGFFDSLEAKYVPASRGSKRSTPMDEPPEELFEANRAKRTKRSTRGKKVEVEEEVDDEEDEDIGESEEEEVKPRKAKARGKAKGRKAKA